MTTITETPGTLSWNSTYAHGEMALITHHHAPIRFLPCPQDLHNDGEQKGMYALNCFMIYSNLHQSY